MNYASGCDESEMRERNVARAGFACGRHGERSTTGGGGGASGDSRDLAGALRAWGLAGLLQRGRRVPGRGVTFRRKVPLH